MKWEVFAFDSRRVIDTFEGLGAEVRAKALAESLDGLALRCYARPVRPQPAPIVPPPVVPDDRTWELGG